MNLTLRCPNCHERLGVRDWGLEITLHFSPFSLQCPNGHTFAYQDGVLVLLADGFAARLGQFTADLSRARAANDKRLIEPALYPQLPFIKTAENWEWRMRQYDLAVVQRAINGRSGLKILDVGAWNGWLSYRLALQGHQVTAVDYFIDEYDGLAAKKFYPVQWQAIQLDLGDLSVLETPFDVVILNRCLQFAPDVAEMVAQARARLSVGGILLITGLQLFADAAPKAQQVAAYRQTHHQQFGFELFLKPTKGYLDWQDKHTLQTLGVQLRPYSRLWLANLKSYLKPALPRHFHGIAKPRN